MFCTHLKNMQWSGTDCPSPSRSCTVKPRCGISVCRIWVYLTNRKCFNAQDEPWRSKHSVPSAGGCKMQLDPYRTREVMSAPAPLSFSPVLCGFPCLQGPGMVSKMKMRAEVSKEMCSHCFASHWADLPELLQPAGTNHTSSMALFDLSRKVCLACVITNLPVGALGDFPKQSMGQPWR